MRRGCGFTLIIHFLIGSNLLLQFIQSGLELSFGELPGFVDERMEVTQNLLQMHVNR